jgi:hypothetical protein|tara:strand:+ start:6177 stop:6503 length:327 start_codon:yes stop_codon:yes gene_type:complete
MSTIKIKEIKDDAIVQIPVNKNYYVMVKAVLYDLFTIFQEKGITAETLQNILKKQYNELSPNERSFYTITLLLAEIEKQATEQGVIDEKEIEVADIEKAVNNADDSTN